MKVIGLVLAVSPQIVASFTIEFVRQGGVIRYTIPIVGQLTRRSAIGMSSSAASSITNADRTSPSSLTSSSSTKTFDVFPYGTEIAGRPTKIVHFLRHAEGTHNVNREYRSRTNIDAELTSKGIEQCRSLADQIRTASSGPLADLREHADLVVTSPLQRCIQTATLSMEPILPIPMVANEMVRETVNYNCDRRRHLDDISSEHTHVDYQHLTDKHDAIWDHYEERFGCDETFTGHRESGEIFVVADRGKRFFDWLSRQEHNHVVVCTHSAFLRCIVNYAHKNDDVYEYDDDNGNKQIQRTGPLGVPRLPPQHADPPNSIIEPVFQYIDRNDPGRNDKDDGTDNTFASEMKRDYANCEIRSMVVAF